MIKLFLSNISNEREDFGLQNMLNISFSNRLLFGDLKPTCFSLNIDLAKNVEADIYAKANSMSEYNQLFAEKIKMIQEEFENRGVD